MTHLWPLSLAWSIWALRMMWRKEGNVHLAWCISWIYLVYKVAPVPGTFWAHFDMMSQSCDQSLRSRAFMRWELRDGFIVWLKFMWRLYLLSIHAWSVVQLLIQFCVQNYIFFAPRADRWIESIGTLWWDCHVIFCRPRCWYTCLVYYNSHYYCLPIRILRINAIQNTHDNCY